MTDNSADETTSEPKNDAPSDPGATKPEGARKDWPASPARPPSKEKEIGGREGPDPTRYDDWEKGGRCIDF